jgi:putative ABC transport system permease protein
MTFQDVVETGLGNMWRMKLRATLTLLGVIIAIAAFVSMLTAGAGIEKNISEQFDKLGLLFTIQVTEKHKESQSDTTKAPPLTDSILAVISKMPGVQFAYPFDDYQIKVKLKDSTYSSRGQALSSQALRTKMFSMMSVGKAFDSDSAKEVLLTEDFLEEIGDSNADSLVGKDVIVSVEVATLDSALIHIFVNDGKPLWDRLKAIRFDSLFVPDYRKRIFERELGSAVGRFIDGYLNARTTVSDTLTVAGVFDNRQGHFRVKPVIFPVNTGQRFNAAGFSGDMTDLVSELSSGQLFASGREQSNKNYWKITVDIKQGYSHKPIVDSVRAMGFRAFSYAEEFEEMTKFFMYFDMGLGVIGLIALFVASLGIINTMMMSITERRREIGVLKSLGADERDIKLMFLVESALIGTIGSIFGILFGWAISRVASAVVKAIMVNQGEEPLELFALPLWLTLAALALGLTVSLIAGYYPSARAARIDPVEALRYE